MKVAAIIPCYRVAAHILDVVRSVLPYADAVYVIDDKCPERSGHLVVEAALSDRVRVIFHDMNKGVGGAVITGYREALADGMDIMVKLDGDGQMDPNLLPRFTHAIRLGMADYVKGNRFFNIDDLDKMPGIRLAGNAMLSFVSKMSSGYWNVMDPTNGYTAIHRIALQELPLNKLAERYFFESDMLFRLYLARAVVRDVPMRAVYGKEISNINIRRVALEFPGLYLRNLFKRFFYSYLLRDFNAGSVQTLVGGSLLLFGLGFGSANWIAHFLAGELTPLGTIMLASLPIILGAQLLLAALAFDISQTPMEPLQRSAQIDAE